MERVHTLLTERAELLRGRQHGSHGRRRNLIALVGPPGSGKSTVAARVVENLNQKTKDPTRKAIALPMDGFHLTRATLDTMPNREEAIARRGAQWTYNADGVVTFIKSLHDTREHPTAIHWAPMFDHEEKDPVINAIKIDADVDLIIIEGNWLLLDEMPWSQIASIVDDTWFIDVDRKLALARVARRHLKSGIEDTWERALYRAEHNDMANGELVRRKLIHAAITVESVEDSAAGL